MSALFAITTRGLETIAGAELGRLAALGAVELGYRRVAFSSDAVLATWLAPRTVDDCFLHLATWNDVPHRREALEQCARLSSALDLGQAARQIRALRPVAQRPGFSLTVNFVGKRNYSGDELKAALGQALARRLSWTWQERDDDAQLNLRMFIEHQTAHLGVRIGLRPLHERSYKLVHVPGSLRPPVAAAMLECAGVSAGERLLDPCCGAGTILVEALHRGLRVLGGDQSETALDAAAANLAAAGADPALQRWDLTALPLADASVERVVTNLPWDRQVSVTSKLEDFHRRAMREIARVLTPGGSATVLTTHPQLVEIPGRTRTGCIEISLHGQTPVIITQR